MSWPTTPANSAATTVTVNGVALNFAAGELLYEGASGGMRGYTDWEITFRLAASPNSTDVCANWPASVKPTAAVPKKGWEYAWIEYQTQWDANAHTMARKPIAVHVEQVYLTADFTALNIP